MKYTLLLLPLLSVCVSSVEAMESAAVSLRKVVFYPDCSISRRVDLTSLVKACEARGFRASVLQVGDEIVNDTFYIPVHYMGARLPKEAAALNQEVTSLLLCERNQDNPVMRGLIKREHPKMLFVLFDESADGKMLVDPSSFMGDLVDLSKY